MYAKGFQAPLPNKNWAHRVPYSPQPSRVAKAKQLKKKASKTDAQRPYTEENALAVMAAPSSMPKDSEESEQRITRDVIVQITIVSTNTSTIPISPCLAG